MEKIMKEKYYIYIKSYCLELLYVFVIIYYKG